MKNIFGFGSGWRLLQGEANYKHEYLFYYLQISPSYQLAYRVIGLGEQIDAKELPNDFSKVIETYKKLGDVYTKHFVEWWKEIGKDAFEERANDRIWIGIDPSKSKDELLNDFKEFLNKLEDKKNTPVSNKVKFEVNKIRLTSLSKRHSLVLERAMFNGKSGFKKEQLWKLLKSVEYPSSRSKEVRLNSKKTANNLEARTYLSILASKNIKQAFYIAENAARGLFPYQEPIDTGLKFDFDYVNKIANSYTNRAMELAIQAEKSNEAYMKIISPTKSYKKIKKVDVGRMLEE